MVRRSHTVSFSPYQRDQHLRRATVAAPCSAPVFCTTSRLWPIHSSSSRHFSPQVRASRPQFKMKTLHTLYMWMILWLYYKSIYRHGPGARSCCTNFVWSQQKKGIFALHLAEMLPTVCHTWIAQVYQKGYVIGWLLVATTQPNWNQSWQLHSKINGIEVNRFTLLVLALFAFSWYGCVLWIRTQPEWKTASFVKRIRPLLFLIKY